MGAYQKAMIAIEKKQVEEIQEKEGKPSVVNYGGLSPSGNITGGLNKATKMPSDSTLKSKVTAASGEADTNIEELEVQFNPVDIQISVEGKPGRAKTGVDINHNNIDYGRNSAKISVTIPLLFDGTLEEQKGSNVVEQSVNHFLNAVRNPYSRGITFSWGNQLYKGELYSASVEYTMFSKQGVPVRAKVTIKILCKDYGQGKEGLKDGTPESSFIH